jgi:hypothetical protein
LEQVAVKVSGCVAAGCGTEADIEQLNEPPPPPLQVTLPLPLPSTLSVQLFGKLIVNAWTESP